MMSRALGFYKKYRWALLSGVLMGTSYIPFPPWALIFCWAPLWWDLVVNTATPRDAFFKAWWAQFVLSLIGFHWISTVAHEFGFLPWVIAIPILLLFAATVHVYIPLAAAAVVYLRNRLGLRTVGSLILLATFHNVGETFWPSVFSWNFGYPLLWINAPWAQWADVIGFLGLSYVMHLLNALVTELWIRRDRRLTILASLLVFAFAGVTAVLGVSRQKTWELTDSSVKALIVQANIGNLEKFFAERGAGYQREIINKYFTLAKQGLQAHPETELLIWPESSIPEFLDDHNRNRRYATQFFADFQTLGRPLAAGAYSNDPPGTKVREDYNSLYLFGANGERLGAPYHKTQLLMFGEYVPLGHVFPILRKWNPGGEGFGRGTGATVFNWGDYKIGAQICYESLDPHFSRSLALQGADFIINITNDSWFGKNFEPEQHLFMTLARAIEIRRPLLRSTNTGISTAIEASGKIHELSPQGKEWTGFYDVKLQKKAPLTFFAQYGGLLPLILGIVVGLVLWRGRRGTSRLAGDS